MKTQYKNQSELIEKLKSRIPNMTKNADSGRSDIGTDQSMIELRMNDQNIIPRSWDFDFDNFPEQLSIQSSSKYVSDSRTILLSESFLRLYAIFDDEMTSETIENDEYRDVLNEFIALRYLVY